MADQQYIAGESITLELEWQGAAPSSATVQVYHPEDGAGAAAAATVASTSTTTSAEAPRGSTALVLTSAAGFEEDHLYRLEPTNAAPRMVRVLRVSGSTVYLDSEVSETIPAGSTLRDPTISYDAGSNLDRVRGYRALWRVTVDGEVFERWSAFDVVHQPFSIHITRKHVRQVWRTAGDTLDSHWPDLYPGAVEEVRSILQGEGYEPDRVRIPDAWRRAAVYWICRQVAEERCSHGEDLEDQIDRFDKYFNGAVKRALKAPVWYDVNDANTRDTSKTPQSPAFWFAHDREDFEDARDDWS